MAEVEVEIPKKTLHIWSWCWRRHPYRGSQADHSKNSPWNCWWNESLLLNMEKTIILVGIYNQQFQGTISIMIFDFRVCISVYLIPIGELIYLEPNDDSIFEGKFLKTNAEIPTKSFGFQVYIGTYIYIYYLYIMLAVSSISGVWKPLSCGSVLGDIPSPKTISTKHPSKWQIYSTTTIPKDMSHCSALE